MAFDYVLTEQGESALHFDLYVDAKGGVHRLGDNLRALLWLAFPVGLCALRSPNDSTDGVARSSSFTLNWLSDRRSYAACFETACRTGLIQRAAT
jgi:hypothetical protein